MGKWVYVRDDDDDDGPSEPPFEPIEVEFIAPIGPGSLRFTIPMPLRSPTGKIVGEITGVSDDAKGGVLMTGQITDQAAARWMSDTIGISISTRGEVAPIPAEPAG
jgi:hypothetical protein